MTNEASYLHETREAILNEAITMAAFEGWGPRLVEEVARALEIDPAKAKLAFPKGTADLLAYASHDADERMLEKLHAHDLGSMKIREKITLAVRLRLEELLRDKDSASRAVHTLAMPYHGALAVKLTYDTVDAIWRGIGDTSADFNFYSKRAILAGVYTSTLARFFKDESEDHAETWAFLDRRIENVMQIEKVKAKARGVTSKLPDPIAALSGLRFGRGRR